LAQICAIASAFSETIIEFINSKTRIIKNRQSRKLQFVSHRYLYYQLIWRSYQEKSTVCALQ